MNIDSILSKQRSYFAAGNTLPVEQRTAALNRLYDAISANELQIMGALYSDLGKSDFESYMCEIGMVLEEISFMRRNLKRFARDKRVKTPLSQFPSRSYIKSVPYGNVLIMGPWNYPLLLTFGPLVDALAAGNTAVIKPSAYSPATSAVIEQIICDCFAPEYVKVVTGGRRENAALLEQKFDFIFFTGSKSVGKEVLRHAAEHLTPVVLELGGKSPCIVDKSADIDLAARRIVFGKYLNCGQTCVAPDYIFCHADIKQQLITAVKSEIARQFGSQPLANPDYGHIVNEKHFDRLLALIDNSKVVFGGQSNRESLQIAPTVMDGVSITDLVMQEEIFGPIMPILTYSDEDQMIDYISSGEKPLALYLFTNDKSLIDRITSALRYGGGCINDTIIHLATTNMPFGGVGESGMGSYHGKAGFDTFSHKKSIVQKSTKIDLPMRYQPYNRENNLGIIKRIMK